VDNFAATVGLWITICHPHGNAEGCSAFAWLTVARRC
jgi:hypothetical protein